MHPLFNIIGLLAGGTLLFSRKEIYFPAKGKITSPFGMRKFSSGPDLHTGIDIIGKIGDPIYSSLDGKVEGIYPNTQLSNYGNAIVIKHGNNLYSLYAHLDKILVSKDQSVFAGDKIAEMGKTAGNKDNPGRVVPVHLHFEFLDKWPPIGKDINRINPIAIFNIAEEAGIKFIDYSKEYIV